MEVGAEKMPPAAGARAFFDAAGRRGRRPLRTSIAKQCVGADAYIGPVAPFFLIVRRAACPHAAAGAVVIRRRAEGSPPYGPLSVNGL